MRRGYIHGFGTQEERRLYEQARVLAPAVLEGLELPARGRLLELGCGVGAELELVAGRNPGLRLTGIDLQGSHLRAARARLGSGVDLVRGDAMALPFRDGSFDAVLTVWMLEHVADPRAVLAEALRVLGPDGVLVCTEVDNDTFRLDPELPAVATWWRRFNHWQRAAGGDPWVGRRLEGLARDLGCRDVSAVAIPAVSTRREPGRRAELADYVRDLLLSGQEALRRAGRVDDALEAAVAAELGRVRTDPGVELEYQAVRLRCRPPAVEG